MNFSNWQKKKIFDYSALDITVKSISHEEISDILQ